MTLVRQGKGAAGSRTSSDATQPATDALGDASSPPPAPEDELEAVA